MTSGEESDDKHESGKGEDDYEFETWSEDDQESQGKRVTTSMNPVRERMMMSMRDGVKMAKSMWKIVKEKSGKKRVKETRRRGR